MKKNILLISIFMLLSFFITACGDSGSSGGGSSNNGSPNRSPHNGMPLDPSNPESFYGEYQILSYVYYDDFENDNPPFYSSDCGALKEVFSKFDANHNITCYENKDNSAKFVLKKNTENPVDVYVLITDNNNPTYDKYEPIKSDSIGTINLSLTDKTISESFYTPLQLITDSYTYPSTTEIYGDYSINGSSDKIGYQLDFNNRNKVNEASLIMNNIDNNMLQVSLMKAEKSDEYHIDFTFVCIKVSDIKE